MPMYFMTIGSFQNLHGVMKMPPNIFPVNASFNNYIQILPQSVFVWLKNTGVVVFCTIVLSVFVSITSGYAFAFYSFKLKEKIWMTLLIGIMIPRISLLIPTYIIIKDLHLSGTLAAVVIPVVFTPIGMYLARNYFETVPKSLLESARIDGANEWTVLFKIVAPISAPIVAALGLFAGVGALNDYIWQMLVLQDPNRFTFMIGLMRLVMLRNDGLSNVNPIGKSFAAGVLMLLPMLLIFLLANKFFVKGLEGAIKE